jgi:hypothetical protein
MAAVVPQRKYRVVPGLAYKAETRPGRLSPVSEGKVRRKQFFFEKKNQKTSFPWRTLPDSTATA